MMIELDWSNDVRNTDVDEYLFAPNDREKGRRTAFLRGWSRFVNNQGTTRLD